MALIWHEAKAEASCWEEMPLSADGYVISAVTLAPIPDEGPPVLPLNCAILRRCDTDSGPRWALLAPPGAKLHFNGDSLRLGIGVLRDRDEIRIEDPQGNSRRYFFSTEELARVETLPPVPSAACPRCKLALMPGDPAVRCPTCGVWHHQTDDRPCWTYAERCAACQSQPTDLAASYRWTPEEL